MEDNREMKMVAHIVANARVIAHEQWEIGEEEMHQMLNDLVDKMENGTITDDEFDKLLEWCLR